MKLIKFIPIAFAGIPLLGFISCQNDLEPQIPNQEGTSIEQSPLVDVLVNVITSHNNETIGDSYILYDTSTDEFTIMSAEDYALANAFAEIIVREDTTNTRAPKGDGWMIGGKGKGKTKAIKIAFDLANKIEKNKNFEIHVEYGDNGNFTVWYRYV